MLAASLLPVRAVTGQIREQIIVNSDEPGFGNPPSIRAFSRKLEHVWSTSLGSETSSSIDEVRTGIAVTANGDVFIPIGSVSQTKLVRVDGDGNLLPTVVIGDCPMGLSASRAGEVYALTRIDSLPGPLYAVDLAGSTLWSNPAGPKSYTGTIPQHVVMTTQGELWIGADTSGSCGCRPSFPEATRIDPRSGEIVGKVAMPAEGALDTTYHHIAASPNGTLWVTSQAAFDSYLYNVDSSGILQSFPIPGTYNGTMNQIRVDAAGDVWVPGTILEANGGLLRKFSRMDGSVLQQFDLGGPIVGYAIGPTGEEIFAVVGAGAPTLRLLVRLNVVTGVQSSTQIDPPSLCSGIGPNDPSGFVYANVIDKAGDNDGDGHSNRSETLAGSSPYDALSRPDGPKVYIDFTASNAVVLIFQDPDGLVDPIGGLDLSSLSLTAGNFGDIFSFLLPFLTLVRVSPDGTQAAAVFGGLPLASDLKLPLEARATDLTGSIGWDWQVTPPGEL